MVEADGAGERHVISWEFAIERKLGPPGADDGLAAHINACSCNSCTRRLAYAPRAIETLRSALRLTPTGHPSVTRCFVKLAREYIRAFRLDDDVSRIDDAISALSRALQLTPRSNSEFPSRLEDLAEILLLRFRHTGNISDLNQAISKRRQVVEATHEGNSSLPCRQHSLGHALHRRFNHEGDLSDISDSIAAHTKALKLRLGGHIRLRFLAMELTRSFQSFLGRIDTLMHDAKSLSPISDAEDVCVNSCGCNITHLLHDIGNLLHARFWRTGELSDIAAAIRVQRLLVRLTPERHPRLPGFLEGLGSSLQDRFQHRREARDIDEAISVCQRSAQLDSGSGGPQSGFCTMYRLATCFLNRYKARGNWDDLDEAIRILQQMVYVNPDDIEHKCVSSWIHGLAISLGHRFSLTRDPRDLAEAISIQERLVQRLEPDEGIILPTITLSHLLKTSFNTFGNLEDIDKAISFGRMVIELPFNKDLYAQLASLAACLMDRVRDPVATGVQPTSFEAFVREDNTPRLSSSLAFDYINEAIALLQKAIDLISTGHPDYPDYLACLAHAYYTRSEKTDNFPDLQEAIATQKRAIRLTPDWHTSKSRYLKELSQYLHSRYHHTGNDEDRAEMITASEAAVASPWHTPREGLQVAIWLARHCSDSTTVVAAYGKAMGAIALMVGLDQTVAQRYSSIHGLSEMPIEAAAVACDFNYVDKAVEWLEQGRCLVWSQINILHTPLEALRTRDRELASEIAEVSRRLEVAGSTRRLIGDDMSQSLKLSLDDEARAHKNLARRWDDLLTKARDIPGFECFLQSVPCSALIDHLPPSGSIVIITAYEGGCSAIALIAGLGEPLHIPLPDLTLSNVMEYRAILNKKLSTLGFRSQVAGKEELDEYRSDAEQRGAGRYRGRDRNVLYVLKALWIEVVKPVLDALAIPKADDANLSTLHRVWWCPTGVLSFLPLHAAGVYSDSGSESVLDYVVSSYTPSISSLLERVRNDREIDETRSGLFLTNQPKVPGYPRIAGTTREVNTVYDIARENGVKALKVEGSELSVDDCLRHMEEYSSVHFACHGSQNTEEPLKSRLRLEKGALELGAIMQKNLKHADLAFLSACETSTGEEKLDNEVVHLAAGMLAAGYRRVVGTMWEIRDSHAVDVANDFYSYLMDHREEGSGSRFDGSRSAHALHHAVRQLRVRIDGAREVRGIPDELEKSLLLWIPYVHYGY
ncbi:hypothetical protein FA13DRAFT_347771 [Coprinellus micaceus]|uniref:CHAT domain-containing protein n=1 Tax=Coprinellus micaceus TaxID=71717 RepID=A0A4Y7SCV0_COPMI|nr:hypothetical protein FA13DRAFT_347771 [Coprinellus micaceus]